MEIKEEIASLVIGNTQGLLPLIICNANKSPFMPSKSNYSNGVLWCHLAQLVKLFLKIKIIVIHSYLL